MIQATLFASIPEVHTIVGYPSLMWGMVQERQEMPFAYFHWRPEGATQDSQCIKALLTLLAEHPLDLNAEPRETAEQDHWAANPLHRSGHQLYTRTDAVRFCGTLAGAEHAFFLDTNHPEVIVRVQEAIRENVWRQLHQQKAA